MSPSERANARIQLEFLGPVPQDLQSLAHQVETRWNQGQFEAALSLAQTLAAQIPPGRIALVVQWRRPRVTSWRWGNDVLVDSFPALIGVQMKLHETTGHLFIIAAWRDDTNSLLRWAAYLSQDQGETWAQTALWTAAGTENIQTDIAMMGDHVYVGYFTSVNPTSARLRRLMASTGAMDTDYGWQEVFDVGVNLKEISLTDNSTYNNNRLYYVGLLEDHTLKCIWSLSDGTSFSEDNTSGINNADRGLDVTWNDGFTSSGLLAGRYLSYITTEDSLVVAAWPSISPVSPLRTLEYTGSLAFFTDITAHRDTLMVAYEYTASSPWRTMYFIKYGNPESGIWYWNFLMGDSTIYSVCPKIVGSHNNGFAVVAQFGDLLHYRHRGYAFPPDWTDPVAVAEHPFYQWSKPALAWLGPDLYGVAYIHDNQRFLFFDRLDRVQVAEPGASPPSPVHFHILSRADHPLLVLQMQEPGQVTLRVFNAAGALVQSYGATLASGEHRLPLAPPGTGVYLVQVTGPGGHQVSSRFVHLR